MYFWIIFVYLSNKISFHKIMKTKNLLRRLRSSLLRACYELRATKCVARKPEATGSVIVLIILSTDKKRGVFYVNLVCVL